MKKALIVVDHGSRLKAANNMIFDVVDMLKIKNKDIIIEGCHMELADPDIASTYSKCVNLGATHIIVQPFMLSPGRHSTSDIPQLVDDIAAQFPTVSYDVRPHFGTHSLIADIILDNSGID